MSYWLADTLHSIYRDAPLGSGITWGRGWSRPETAGDRRHKAKVVARRHAGNKRRRGLRTR